MRTFNGWEHRPLALPATGLEPMLELRRAVSLRRRDAAATQLSVGFLVKTLEIGKRLNLLILRITVHFPGIHDSHDCGIARAAVSQYCLAS